ncbi:phosphate ABC transporter substrate-binding protein PstS [Chamaesiphon minutus]|uniref:Phosphate-binding protein n=1 Tax=Chamaesiphon minutus (strain ATCC 27169 / PCC 6605) TaxID=1173020 RepID=K9UF05_CHAP6|nr:phosphate ABC transporter substrate-binding protein PstS [Chamaesiphon minutus]AFY93707.1 phosphate ABC transporter, phosphate-binding protein [Chamaesiphon minutus PCC 6605]
MLSKNFGRFTTLTAVAVAFFGTQFAAVAQQVTLSGAGATFPQPLYERYTREMRKAHPDIKVNYQAIGSGGGIKQTIAGTVDFGASDAAMTDSQMSQVKGGVLLIPTAGGPVSVAYNLPVKGLKLSNKALSGIFLGKITTWNDPQIAQDNKGLSLPNTALKPVVRADGSGTAFIFTNHVSAISPEFKSAVGASTEPKWSSGFLKGKGNPGVSALVKQTPGAIGFMEYSFALRNGLNSAAVQNGSGRYVAPSLKAANQALADVQFPANFRAFDVNSNQGYPIVGLTWLLIPKNQKTPAKAQAIKTMVRWMLTSGQQFNDDLGYTSIPSSVAARAIEAVESGVK